jgi:uncharacterized membrane protein YhaH (DUF805 family)
MNWYIEAVKKYSVFTGRARRKEYWYFTLFNIVIIIPLTLIDMMTGTFSNEANMGLFSGVFILAILIPSIAVSIRRLHDTNRTGWWMLISFIPILGPIVLLIFLVQDSQIGDNRYGPNPKEEIAQVYVKPS